MEFNDFVALHSAVKVCSQWEDSDDISEAETSSEVEDEEIGELPETALTWNLFFSIPITILTKENKFLQNLRLTKIMITIFFFI